MIDDLKNKYFAIQNDKGCFCSKCGKRLLNDSYNIKKHQAECVKYEIIDRAINDNEQYGYAFRLKDDNLLFIVYSLNLNLRPGFSDRYIGGKWKIVFKATFKKDTKELKEEGLYNVDVWFKMLLEKTGSICLNKENPEKIIRSYFKSIPFVYSFGDFLDIYRQRGYKYNNIDIEKIKEINESKFEMPTSIKTYIYEFEHKIGKDVVLELIVVKNGEKIARVFISKDFYYCDSDIDYNIFSIKGNIIKNRWREKILEKENVEYVISSLEEFNKAYPELLLEKYFESGGTNLFQAVMSSNYNKMIENLCKCGLGYIADRTQLLENVNIYGNNVKEIFGQKQNIIKIFNNDGNFDLLNIEDIFETLDRIKQIQPAILNINLSHNAVFVLYSSFTKNKNAAMRNRFPGVCNFNKDELLKLAKKLTDEVVDIYSYSDYLILSNEINAYPYGKVPKNIEEAHDYIREIYEYHKNAILAEKFEKSVNRTEYLLLDSTAELDKDGKVHYKKTEEEYRIIVPKKQFDLTKESESLNHCVRTYIGRVAEQHTFILFLRRTDELSKSFATIEVTNNKQLIQLKAVNNTRAPKDAQEFVKKWAANKKITLNSYDIN